MPASLRNWAKGVVEVVAHRGGQAVGSVVILAWLAAFPSTRMLWMPVLAGGLGWIVLARASRESMRREQADTELH